MTDQAYSGGNYPSMPPAPGGPVAAPTQVTNAVKLMFVRAAISLLGLLAAFLMRDSLAQIIKQQNPAFDDRQLDTALTAGLAVSVVFGLVYLVLYVLLALQVQKGRSWARIVTLVLAGLSVLSGLYSLFAAAPALSKGLGLVTLLLDVAIFALLVIVVVANAVLIWVKAVRAGGLPTTEVPWHESQIVAPSGFLATPQEKEAVREWEAAGHGARFGGH